MSQAALLGQRNDAWTSLGTAAPAVAFQRQIDMTQSEISRLEHAGRSAMAWIPEGYDGKRHFDTLIEAMVPGLALLAIAATLLAAVL